MTSLGKGIGLQSPNRDDYWIKESVRLDEQQKAQAEKDKDALFNMADLKVDGKVLLPAYGKAAAKVQLDLYNKFAQYNQQNPHVAKNLIQQDVVRAQQELSSIYSGNENWKRYAEAKGIMKDNEALNAVFSTDTELPQLQKYNNDFLFTDEKGGFNFVEVPDAKILPKYDKYGVEETLTGKNQVVGNSMWSEVRNDYPESAVSQEGLTLAADPIFRQQKLYETRNWQPEAGESLEGFAKRKADYVNSESIRVAKENKPPSYTKLRDSGIYKPPASDKKDEPIDLRPLAQYDIASKVIDVSSGKSTNTKVPIQINLPEKINPAVIPTGLDVLDVETNKQVSENPTNLSFTPSTLQYKNITRTKNGVKTKSREWYVLGTAIDIAKANEVGGLPPIQSEGESDADYNNRKMTWGLSVAKASEGQKPGSKKTTFNVMVPLASVRGALKGVTQSQLDELANEYDNKQEKPVKMITVEAFGKVGEIPEDQFEAVKKKDPNAKIR